MTQHAIRPLRVGRVVLAVGAFAAAAALLLAGSAPASAATPGCGLQSTNGTVTKSVGGRTYELHVPDGLAGEEVPLLLSLHGFGSNGRQDEQSTGWSGFADSHNFIVAYPNGRPGYGGGAWDPYTTSSPDVAFLRAVVDDIAATYCVDENRVHADGWSNGAVMSQRLACNAADKFASVTSYGGGTPTFPGAAGCAPSRPVSVGLFAGQYDFTYVGLAQNTSQWVGIDSCNPTPARTTDQYGRTDTYSCAAGAEVLSRVVSNTSHNWPPGPQAEDQRSRMWAFLQANPLP